MGQLLPVIKNFEWFKDDLLILKEALMDFDQSPVIGIAEDLDSMIKFSEATNSDLYKTELSERKKVALENLKNLEVTYEVQDLNGYNVIVSSGQQFASEKILDPSYLKKIHEELNSEEIAIGIPFQGLLIAISAKDSVLINKFPSVVKKHYENAQTDKISDRIFLSVNGIIVAHAGIETHSSPVIAEEPCFVQTMTLPGATEKDVEYVVFIGHKNIGILQTTLKNSYSELLEKCKSSEFETCKIKYMIIPDIVPKSDELTKACLTLANSFCSPENTYPDSLILINIIFNYDQDTVLAEQTYIRS